VACTRSWNAASLQGGTTPTPVREKRPKGACVQPTVPSLVPMPAQTAAKMRGSPPKALECNAETDSALEGTGFEPSVPLKAPSVLVVSVLLSRRLFCSQGSIRGDMRLSNLWWCHAVPMVRIRFPPAASLGLAQTRPFKAEKPAFPRGCAPWWSAETRSTGRDCANRRGYLCRAIFQYRSAADVFGAGEAVPQLKLRAG
jgi:hypothetical protein